MMNSRFRNQEQQDVEIDMVPIMNMFLVLIPFLLISSSFLHLKVINTSIPVKSASTTELTPEQSEVKLTLMVALNKGVIEVKPSASELSDAQLKKLDFSVKRTDDDAAYQELTARLSELKQTYPNSDTVILSPDDSVPYQDMIRLMDAARGPNPEDVLFGKVVLSGILK